MEGVQQQLGEAREQLGAALEYVMADVRQKWRELSGGPSVSEGLRAFVAAVDWSERWLQGLLAFHLTLLVLVVALRRLPYLHYAVFLGIAPVVYFAERLNALAGRHWRAFAKQNYFDPQGIFFSAVVSAPLLLVMFAILVNYLITTSVLLVRMKRRELLYRARQAARAKAAGGADAQQQQQQQQQAGAGGGGGGAAAGEAKKER